MIDSMTELEFCMFLDQFQQDIKPYIKKKEPEKLEMFDSVYDFVRDSGHLHVYKR